MEQPTQERYGKVATDMILFCLSLALEEFEDYSHPVPPCQKLAAEEYVSALESGKGEIKALQDLLYTLFTQDRETSSQYALTVYRFLILYSFKQEGHLTNADVITQYISALAFLGRAAIYGAIRESMKQEKKGFFK